MLDRERILAKIDELHGYLREIRQIAPQNFQEYQKPEKKRACERLLQISIECVVDICGLIVAGLRLGLPSEEDDIFEKLAQSGVVSAPLKETLREMKGFRNILVHKYGRVDDRIVYETLRTRMGDFERFEQEILEFLRREKYLQ